MRDDDHCRPYREEDFSRLCEIHDLARRDELRLSGLEAAFLPLRVAAEREGFHEYEVDVLERGGVVLGFVAYKDDEIGWLYVSPKHYRKGVGAALCRRALSQLAGSEVFVEVLAGNEPAFLLYRSLGFGIVEKAYGAMPGNEAFDVEVYVLLRRAEDWRRKPV
ncbi:MAG: GNAT family N-acetyltransferase [Rhodobacteraceae bacterium]|nr:GNAT family N-acetyltransferase [Paracoccaceae bacterium]